VLIKQNKNNNNNKTTNNNEPYNFNVNMQSTGMQSILEKKALKKRENPTIA
jgi:hypothetical protein